MGDDIWHGGVKKAAHKVTLTKPFYLGKYEVTQEQWQAVMGNNPSKTKGPKNPVDSVTWNDCQDFFKKLNPKIAASGKSGRLPTEAEWEYACRAGTQTPYFFGDDEKQLDDYAWYIRNGPPKTIHRPHPVGQKKPNPWGLYDMYGNVTEWCADWVGSQYYEESPVTDPKGPETGTMKALRGGSVEWDAPWCSSLECLLDKPSEKGPGDRGIRIVCEDVEK
jgi:formylglycine-generating enzyme required for sulfatase activity